MSSFRFGRIAATVAVTAGTLATSVAGATAASAAADPPQDQELIAKVVCVSRGDNYVKKGQISSYTCTKRGDVWILHWTK